ncbi:serum response factor homolog isoform X3 [Procambarus clarkii]|uniref:serum response factor homolog isoform X3 n=1 Tax=Procambarus clarkii TaxID=6728 RepID=UPI001E673314|nr:serum response factor homolog isoform X3 [Procambarus clarkii]
MQNQSHNSVDDKFAMNFGSFDPELFSQPHMNAAMGGMGGLVGMKRSAHDAGLDREPLGLSSDDDSDLLKKDDKMNASSSRESLLHHQTALDGGQQQAKTLPNGKKTKGRVKIKMEFIDNKLRRYTTFSKRKTGIMKKAYELSTLTGTQVMLLVASETGHVYTFATRKLQPMITSEAGKALIQTCLNSPDPPQAPHHHDQRMSATGFEETELTYAVTEDEHKDGLGRDDYLGGGSSSQSDSSSPPTPTATPTPTVSQAGTHTAAHNAALSQALPVQLPPGLVLTPSVAGGSVVMGGSGGSVMYAASGGVVYAAPHTDRATPLLLNLPHGLQVAHDQNGSGSSPLVTLPMALTSAALQQSAVAAAVSAASISSSSSSSSQAAPTDLSMPIKREKRL